jgi:hypothetical protein
LAKKTIKLHCEEKKKMNNSQHLITHNNNSSNNNKFNTKQLQEDYLKFLEHQLDGLPGGNDFSYYTFSWSGMKNILKYLKEYAEFSNKSMFLDVGSGRGHLVFCVANILDPVMSYGIEVDHNRYLVAIIKIIIIINIIIIYILDFGSHKESSSERRKKLIFWF